jgi:hypothetical protein
LGERRVSFTMKGDYDDVEADCNDEQKSERKESDGERKDAQKQLG